MVAIVSGNTLGLNLTSKGVLGDAGVSGNPTQGQGGEQVYVNAATGNLVMQQLQDELVGAGLDIASVLTYNSRGLANDDNGDNFSLGKVAVQLALANTVNTPSSTLTRTAFDGSQSVFTWNATTSSYQCVNGAGAFDSITYSSAASKYTWVDGSTQEKETYDGATKRLLTRADAAGNTLTFGYDANGQLNTITDANGEVVTLVYSGNKLMSISAPVTNSSTYATVAQQVVSYAYDASNRLASITLDLTPDGSTADGNVYVTSFTYDGASARVATMQQTDGTKLIFVYDASQRVYTITDALSNVTTFAYDTANRKTSVTANGQTTVYGYDATSGLLTSVTAPPVNGVSAVVQYVYNASGELTALIDGNGQVTSYTYDAAGNQTSVLDAAGNLTSRTYDAQNRLVTATTSTLARPALVATAGMTINGGVVTKTGATNAWDAAVRSVNAVAGAATVSFVANSPWNDAMVGLNADPDTDVSYGSIDYALYLDNGTLRIYAGGNLVTTLGTYGVGDRFSVSYDGNNHVNFFQNGSCVYSMAATVTQPLYLDTSFWNQTATVANLQFGAGAMVAPVSTPPSLTSAGGMSVSGGLVTKTSTSQNWDAGVRSVASATGAATVAFTATSALTYLMVGLNSDPDTDASYASLDYAFYLQNGTLLVYSNGASVSSVGPYVAGDRLAVSYDGNGHVNFVRNGQLVYTMAANVTQPLYMDSSFYTSGASISNLQFGPGANTDPTLVNSGGMFVSAGGNVTKAIAGNPWDSSVYSATGATGPVSVNFTAVRTANNVMVGLNTDPTTDTSYTSIDYAFYLNSGTLQAYQNGSAGPMLGNFAAGDNFSLSYDGTGHVNFIQNGKTIYSVAAAITQPLYADTSFWQQGSGVANLTFVSSPSTEQVTRYVYSADGKGLLRFAISPAGRVTEYGYDAAGALTSENEYASNTYNTGTIVPTEAQMVAWRSSQDLTQSKRTEYVRGTDEQVTKTSIFGTTASNGTGVVDAHTQVTNTVYDKRGDVLKMNPGTPVTTFVVDGLGRVTSKTEDIIGTTTTTYADAAGKVMISFANQLVRTETLDKAGRVTSSVDTASGVTQGSTTYAYDALGRVLRTTDATGVSTWALYDTDGRKDADIDATGAMTEYVYDTASQVTKTITYATRVNTALLVDGNGVPVNPPIASVRPAASTYDQRRWAIYDGDGRVTYAIDGMGSVTSYRYDGNGQLVATYQYATPIDVSTLGNSPTSINAVSSANDRITRNFYDADGNLAGTLDPDRFLTEYQYDSAGQRTCAVRYSTASTVTGDSTLAQARPAVAAADARSATLYDLDGNVTGVVDPTGALTASYYNADGTLNHTTTYAARVTLPVAAGTNVASIAVATPGADLTTSYTYDAHARVQTQTDPLGTVTTYTYETGTGNVISTAVTSSLPGAATTQTRFDKLGRVIATLSALGSAAITAGMSVSSAWAQYGTTYTYDLAGRRASMANPLGNRTLYFYDADGRLRYTVDAKNQVQELRYDAFGNVGTTLRYASAINTSGVGAGGLITAALTSAVAAAANSTADLVSRTVHDLDGRAVLTIDPSGSVTQIAYDALGNVATTRLYASTISNSSASTDAQLVAALPALADGTRDRITNNEYNADGQLVYSVDALGHASRIVYDTMGRAVYALAPDGSLSRSQYDPAGRIVKSTTFATKLSPSTMVGLAHVPTLAQIDALVPSSATSDAVTQNRYDALGRLRFTMDGTGGLSELRYDADGNVIDRIAYANLATWNASADPTVTADVARDRHVHSSFDAFGRVLAQADGTGAVVMNAYDADGNRTDRTSYATRIAPGSWTSGQSPSVTTDAARDIHERFVYNAVGQLTYSADGTGAVTSYAYDATGNLIQKTTLATLATPGQALNAVATSPGLDRTERFGFDAFGRQVWHSDAAGALDYSGYDADGRVVMTVQYATPNVGALPPGNAALATGIADRITRVAYSAFGQATYSVDALNRVSLSAYLQDGRLKSQTRYAATIATGAAATSVASNAALDETTLFQYDAAGHLSQTTDAMGGVQSFTYDGVGNKLTLTDEKNQVWSYTYDADGRQLTQASPTVAVTNFTVNDAGKLAQLTTSANLLVNPGAETGTLDGWTAAGDAAPSRSHIDTGTFDPGINPHAGKDDFLGGTGLLLTLTQNVSIASIASPTFATVSFWQQGYNQGSPGDNSHVQLSFRDASGAVISTVSTAVVDSHTGAWTQGGDKFAIPPGTTSIDYTMYFNRASGSDLDSFVDDNSLVITSSAPPVSGESIVTATTYDGVGNLVQRVEGFGRSDARRTAYTYDAAGHRTSVQGPAFASYDSTGAQTGSAAPVSRTFYDAFGNVVATLGAMGEINYTAYDQANRAAFTVDALGFVTGQMRDAFGDVLVQTKYAGQTTLIGAAPTSATNAPTASAVSSAVASLSHTDDRVTTCAYDNLGRVISRAGMSGYFVDAVPGLAFSFGEAAATPTMKYQYDAFGDLVVSSQLVNQGSAFYASTYHFFDAAGQETDSIDAMGYQTHRSFDAFGNVTQSAEYANAKTGTWSATSLGVAPTLSANDRSTSCTYDRLNRKSTETRLVDYSLADDGIVSGHSLTSSWGYDAAGNVIRTTDAAGASTYREYDALGRLRAVIAPARSSTIDGSTLTPITEYSYDAFDNATVVAQRANSATGVSEFAGVWTATGVNGYAVAAAAGDRITRTMYDGGGHVVQVDDPMAATASFHSTINRYDADGRLAYTFHKVNASDGDTVGYKVDQGYRFDAKGQMLASIASAGIGSTLREVTTNFKYNAFGEMTGKGIGGSFQEFYSYDNNGNLWLTNSGSGVVTAFVHDLQGNVATQYASQGVGHGDVDLSTATSIQAVIAQAPSLRGVSSIHDLVGNTLRIDQASRSTIDAGVTVRVTPSGWSAIHSGSTGTANTLALAFNPVGVYDPYPDQVGPFPLQIALGNGQVQFTINYKSSDGTASTATIVEDASNVKSPYTASWIPASHPGISSVTSVTIAKKDVDGNWNTVANLTGTSTPLTQIEIDMPDDPRSVVTFTYTNSSGTAVTLKSPSAVGGAFTGLVGYGSVYSFNSSTLPVGTYSYSTTVTSVDGMVSTPRTGTFTVGSGALQSGTTVSSQITPSVFKTYDRWGNLLTMTDPRSAAWVTSFQYNSNNQLVQETLPVPSAGGTAPVTRYFYDRQGNRVAVVDADNHVRGQLFDNAGQLVETDAHPDSSTLVKTTNTFDIFGEIVQSIAGDGYTTTGVATANIANYTTRNSYDVLGNLTAVQHGTGAGNVVDVVGGSLTAVNERQAYTYDAEGHRLSSWDDSSGAHLATKYTYDAAGHLASTTLPLVSGRSVASTATYEYDDFGHEKKETDTNGNAETWTYDYFGRVTAHKDLGTTTYGYTYDHAGQLTHQTSTAGQDLSYFFDTAGQMVGISDGALGETTLYTYDAAGNHLQESVAIGTKYYQDNHLAYDALGRLMDSSDGETHVSFQYDGVGNRTFIGTHVLESGGLLRTGSVSQPDATRYFTYDGMNRQLHVNWQSATLQGQQGHSLTYDADGNRMSDVFMNNLVTVTGTPTTSGTGPDGAPIYTSFTNQSYNTANGLVTELYTYDANDRLMQTLYTLKNDSTTGWIKIDGRTYDSAGHLMSKGAFLPGLATSGNKATLIQWFNSINSGTGLVGLHLDSGKSTSFAYDEAGELIMTSAGSDALGYSSTTYTYDAAGNEATNTLNTRYREGVSSGLLHTSTIANTNTIKAAEGYETTGVSSVQSTTRENEDGSTTAPDPTTVTSATTFDVNGHLNAVNNVTSLPSTYVSDEQGNVLRQTTGGVEMRNLVVNGESLGQYGIDGSANVNEDVQRFTFTFGFASMEDSTVQTGTTTTVAGEGETLEQVAMAAYGDSQLWQRIAAINGLDPRAALQKGQRVVVAGSDGQMFNTGATFATSRATRMVTPTQPATVVSDPAMTDIQKDNYYKDVYNTLAPNYSGNANQKILDQTITLANGLHMTNRGQWEFKDTDPNKLKDDAESMFMGFGEASFISPSATMPVLNFDLASLLSGLESVGNAGVDAAASIADYSQQFAGSGGDNGADAGYDEGIGDGKLLAANDKNGYRGATTVATTAGMSEGMGGRVAPYDLPDQRWVDGHLLDDQGNFVPLTADLPPAPSDSQYVEIKAHPTLLDKLLNFFTPTSRIAEGEGDVVPQDREDHSNWGPLVKPSRPLPPQQYFEAYDEKLAATQAAARLAQQRRDSQLGIGLAAPFSTFAMIVQAKGGSPQDIDRAVLGEMGVVTSLAGVPVSTDIAARDIFPSNGFKGAYASFGNTGNAAAVAGNGAAEPLLLGYTPTTNTLAQIRGMSQPQAWQAGEQYVQELAGSPGQAHFDVPAGPFGDSAITGSGGRFVDAPVTAADGSTIANEVKTYKQWTTVNGSPVQQTVPLSPQIQQQVLKDSWLQTNVQGYNPRWIFLDAPPSPELTGYLTRNSIDYVIHH